MPRCYGTRAERSVTSRGQTATYGYFPSSGLLNTTSFTGGTVMSRTYDSQGRIQTITNTPASGTPQSYGYTYNNLNQRTRIARTDRTGRTSTTTAARWSPAKSTGATTHPSRDSSSSTATTTSVIGKARRAAVMRQAITESGTSHFGSEAYDLRVSSAGEVVLFSLAD
jgi:YD repeat-containing protein